MSTEIIQTARLRTALTASIAAFAFGTCVLSTTYAEAAPTEAEILTEEALPEEPEFWPVVAVGVGLFAVGFAVGWVKEAYSGKAEPPSVQIPIQTPIKGLIKGVDFIKFVGTVPQMSGETKAAIGYTDEFLD